MLLAFFVSDVIAKHKQPFIIREIKVAWLKCTLVLFEDFEKKKEKIICRMKAIPLARNMGKEESWNDYKCNSSAKI